MHAETMRIVAARQVEEMHAVARVARLARQPKGGRGATSRSVLGAGIGGRNARRQRLLERCVPGWPRPA